MIYRAGILAASAPRVKYPGRTCLFRIQGAYRYPDRVTFRPESLRGADAGGTGKISYRLARDAVVADFRRGRLSRLDVCDAHPELMRAARHVGETTAIDCPICEEQKVVLVSYAFGNRLPPNGMVVTSRAELKRAAGRGTNVICYVVEVCPDCSWNHLAQVLPVTARRAG